MTISNTLRIKPLLQVVMGVCVLATVSASGASAYEFEIKLKKDPNLSVAYEALQAGEFDLAVTSYERALKSDLTNRQTFNAHNGLCIALNKREEYFRALDHCDHAISLRKGYFGGYVNRGNVFLELKEFDEAIKNYMLAKELVPGSFIPDRNIEIANYLRDETQGSTAPLPPELITETCDPSSDSSVVALN